MAERPVFIPRTEGPPAVKVLSLPIHWYSGFALVQKQKNVVELHAAAARAGYSPLLEISSKSVEELGRRLSAFSLKLAVASESIPLECVYQGSKVFEGGGPYMDLYKSDPRTAKRDERIRNSGRLTGFSFFGFEFPLEPRTLFYDWIYIMALWPHHEFLRERLAGYAGYTDIEFNPQKSVNCQARSCALYVALMRSGLMGVETLKPDNFLNMEREGYRTTGGDQSIF